MGKLGHGTISVSQVPIAFPPAKDQVAGPVPVRQEPKVGTRDLPAPVAAKYVLVSLARIESHLLSIARQIEDRTKLVDEYEVNSVYITPATGEESIATVEVLPQFDTIAEKIESVIITGPVSTACVLQLGDRLLNLSTDATGKVLISPVAFLLNRSDRRILTSSTQGAWTLELMGIADARF